MAGHFFPVDLYFYDRWRTDLLVSGIISAIYVQIASHREMRAESLSENWWVKACDISIDKHCVNILRIKIGNHILIICLVIFSECSF